MTDQEKIKQLEELIINLQIRISALENRPPEIKYVPQPPSYQVVPMATSTTSTFPITYINSATSTVSPNFTYTLSTGGYI